MNIIIYIAIFLIGIMFGSFYTLATYRIPKKQDIIYTHSYCPNCNKKLGFFELVPILSYIFLGGKCKHCKKKINPRYIIFEILSGIIFLLFALALNLNIQSNINNFIYFVLLTLYLTFIFLISGIDKENRKIEISVLLYGIIISIIYMIYLYIIESVSIYRYIIYITIFLILGLIDYIASKKLKKMKYTNYILMYIIVMSIFTGEYVTINSIIVTMFWVAIYLLIRKLNNKINKKQSIQISDNIPIAYFLGVSNIIIFLIITFLIC